MSIFISIMEVFCLVAIILCTFAFIHNMIELSILVFEIIRDKIHDNK